MEEIQLNIYIYIQLAFTLNPYSNIQLIPISNVVIKFYLLYFAFVAVFLLAHWKIKQKPY